MNIYQFIFILQFFYVAQAGSDREVMRAMRHLDTARLPDEALRRFVVCLRVTGCTRAHAHVRTHAMRVCRHTTAATACENKKHAQHYPAQVCRPSGGFFPSLPQSKI
jgi:hypothetical protein